VLVRRAYWQNILLVGGLLMKTVFGQQDNAPMVKQQSNAPMVKQQGNVSIVKQLDKE